eukprot:7006566-Pyramimonas_sp.AAC.1
MRMRRRGRAGRRREGESPQELRTPKIPRNGDIPTNPFPRPGPESAGTASATPSSRPPWASNPRPEASPVRSRY